LGDARTELEANGNRLADAVTQNQNLDAEVVRVKGMLTDRERELGKVKTELEARADRLAYILTQKKNLEAEVIQGRQQLAGRESQLKEMKAEVESHITRLSDVLRERENLETEVIQRRETLANREKELGRVRTTLEGREIEVNQLKVSLTSRNADLEEARKLLQVHEGELERLREKGKSISSELDLLRHKKVIRLLNRVFNKSDLQNDLPAAFLQLKDDGYIFGKGLEGFKLLPGKNLQRVLFAHYPVELNRANLKGVLMAPILDFPSRNGVFGIEIVSLSGDIVAHSVIPSSQIDEAVPTRLDFSPIRDSDRGRFWLRVFVRDVDAPLRVLEWKKYGLLGVGSPQTRAFCGFLFENME
jgi:predicted  nucleic acid-binding Zn-ribbon protein